MRIIAGEFRGRKILPPADAKTTRPITDRVKQAVFDKLESHALLDEGHVVDIFSGTGSLGLEALSRGSDFCTFVDQDPDAIARLQQNLDALELNEYAQVVRSPANALLWTHSLKTHGPIEVAFLDPPYALMRQEDPDALLAPIFEHLLPCMNPTGIAALRLPLDVDPLPVPYWRGPRIDRHGSMKMAYYAPDVAADEANT